MRNVATLMIICLMATQARAALITYNLVGKVTQAASGPMYQAPVSVGSDIPIMIMVDTSFPANGSQSYPQYDPVTMTNRSIIPSAIFAGKNVDGFFQSVTTTTTSISFFTGTPLTGFGFSLGLTGASPGVLQPGLLPSALNPGQFTGGTFAVTQLFNPQSGGYSGYIESVAAPEPATLALLGSGLIGLVLVRRKKRQVH